MRKFASSWRPSPAMIVALVALFAAAGVGSAYAASKINGATVKKNSLPGNRVEKKSLPGNRVKQNSLPGNRIKQHTVGVNQLQTSALTPACKSGTALSQGVCIELTARLAATYNDAVDTCASIGGRLPGAQELNHFTRKIGTIGSAEWSGDLSSTTNAFTVNPDGSFSTTALNSAALYRCVLYPTP